MWRGESKLFVQLRDVCPAIISCPIPKILPNPPRLKLANKGHYMNIESGIDSNAGFS